MEDRWHKCHATGRYLYPIPAHFASCCTRFTQCVRRSPGHHLRKSSSIVIRDAERKPIEAAGCASGFANFHQDFVPALVKVHRNTIGPVIVEFVPERSSKLCKYLLMV